MEGSQEGDPGCRRVEKLWTSITRKCEETMKMPPCILSHSTESESSDEDRFELIGHFFLYLQTKIADHTCGELLRIGALNFSCAICPGNCPADPASVSTAVHPVSLDLGHCRTNAEFIFFVSSALLEFPAVHSCHISPQNTSVRRERPSPLPSDDCHRYPDGYSALTCASSAGAFALAALESASVR